MNTLSVTPDTEARMDGARSWKWTELQFEVEASSTLLLPLRASLQNHLPSSTSKNPNT